jgi:hypothetical protein
MRLHVLKSLSLCVIACALHAPASHAAYTITLQEVGANVVATGSGSLNLAALMPAGGLLGWPNALIPDNGTLGVGPLTANCTLYTGMVSFPTAVGTGGFASPTTGTGSFVGTVGGGYLVVPLRYVSGTSLDESETTYVGRTLAGLGLAPGEYVWSWGEGSTADSLTVRVGALPPPTSPPPPPAPDPLTLLKLKVKAIAKVGSSLSDKLVLAETYYEVPDVAAGCSMMSDFMSQVRALAGKKFTDAFAAELTDGAQQVMTNHGCP